MRDSWLFYLCHYVILFRVCLDHLGFILSKSVLYFLLPRQETGWEEHLRVGPFCVEWDVKN